MVTRLAPAADGQILPTTSSPVQHDRLRNGRHAVGVKVIVSPGSRRDGIAQRAGTTVGGVMTRWSREEAFRCPRDGDSAVRPRASRGDNDEVLWSSCQFPFSYEQSKSIRRRGLEDEVWRESPTNGSQQTRRRCRQRHSHLTRHSLSLPGDAVKTNWPLWRLWTMPPSSRI